MCECFCVLCFGFFLAFSPFLIVLCVCVFLVFFKKKKMPMLTMIGTEYQVIKKFRDLLASATEGLCEQSPARTIHLDEVDVLLASDHCEALMK